MPVIERTAPGVFSWIDLMSPDVDASVAFYTAVLGWTAEEQHDEHGNRIYVMFRRDGHAVAGLGGQTDDMAGMPAVWNSYVATDDLDASMHAVDGAGGKVLLPAMDVLSSGRMAVVAGPDGAMVSLWQGGDHAGVELANEPGTWVWTELLTRDLDAAMGFYASVFGWEYEAQDMGPGRYEVAAVDGHQHAGLMPMPDGMPEEVPSHWSVNIAVADLDAALAAVDEHGGRAVSPVIDIPGMGRQVTVHDPQGGSLALFEFQRQEDD